MATIESQLRASEIKNILLDEIEQYGEELRAEEIGEVLEVKDGIARVYGLSRTMASEMLEVTSSDTGEVVTALALNLEEDNIGAVVLGDWTVLHEGDQVRRTGRVLDIPVGPDYLGRVVNPLGEPIDGKGPIPSVARRQIDIVAPGIVLRQPVKEPMQTGIKAIDALIPIGRGQRELIIGDRGTGKTAVAIDTIINQKGQGVVCVYVAIGQKASTVAGVVRGWRTRARWSTPSSWPPPPPTRPRCSTSRPTPAPRSPSTSCTPRTRTARASRRSASTTTSPSRPRRTARSRWCCAARRGARRTRATSSTSTRACWSAPPSSPTRWAAGALTALPIIETQAGDVSAYIPTNVISITDGQIFLESSLFYSGVRPAVNVGISVSRVGGSAQIKAMKKVAGKLKGELAQYRELEAFAALRLRAGRRSRSASWRAARARWRC